MSMRCSVKRFSVRRLATDAAMLCVALVFSYLEAVLPLSAVLPLPGMRLGLCQLAVTVTFFLVGRADAALVSLVRVLLMGILFGSATTLWFSVCGALLAFGGLCLGARFFAGRMSFAGLGIFCAALHNFGQCLAAATLFGNAVIVTYLPVLLIASVFFGGAGGILLNRIVGRLERFKRVD